ncbi:MAG: DegT/DnrJ/EryC1/StrS family aminotransferase, partial [Candidatus Omnitrophota bacterium]
MPQLRSQLDVEAVRRAIRGCLPQDRKDFQLHEPCLCGNEWDYVKECLDTNWVSSVGKFVDRFEQDLARYTGVASAVAMVNGTSALHIALKVCGVEPQDEVLVPA